MEIKCIKEVVYAEARGEPTKGQIGVAYTILNRAKQSHKDVCKVVKQPGQYKYKHTSKDFNIPVLDSDPTKGAISFKRSNVYKWGKLHRYITIGKHTFYGQ